MQRFFYFCLGNEKHISIDGEDDVILHQQYADVFDYDVVMMVRMMKMMTEMMMEMMMTMRMHSPESATGGIHSEWLSL